MFDKTQVIELGEHGWLVDVYTPTSVYKHLSGFKVSGSRLSAVSADRIDLVRDESVGWLDKLVGFLIPLDAGVYRCFCRDVSEESRHGYAQFIVSCVDDEWTLRQVAFEEAAASVPELVRASKTTGQSGRLVKSVA